MQEILSYAIIIAAATAALTKFYIRFLKKKKVKEKCVEPEIKTTSGCGGCGADCPVRQSAYQNKAR